MYFDAALNDYLSDDNTIAAGLLAEVQYVVVGGPSFPATYTVREEDVLAMFDAPTLGGDVLYKREASGRVARILW
jgi:hypothetical protein